MRDHAPHAAHTLLTRHYLLLDGLGCQVNLDVLGLQPEGHVGLDCVLGGPHIDLVADDCSRTCVISSVREAGAAIPTDLKRGCAPSDTPRHGEQREATQEAQMSPAVFLDDYAMRCGLRPVGC
jgi:hypothetical protein